MSAKGFFSGLLFFVALVVFGFMLGGFLGGKVFGGSQMGWDRLADALGGMALGVIGAVIVGVVLVRRLSNRQRVVWALIALVGASLALVATRFYPDGTNADVGLVGADGSVESRAVRPLSRQGGHVGEAVLFEPVRRA